MQDTYFSMDSVYAPAARGLARKRPASNAPCGMKTIKLKDGTTKRVGTIRSKASGRCIDVDGQAARNQAGGMARVVGGDTPCRPAQTQLGHSRVRYQDSLGRWVCPSARNADCHPKTHVRLPTGECVLRADGQAVHYADATKHKRWVAMTTGTCPDKKVISKTGQQRTIKMIANPNYNPSKMVPARYGVDPVTGKMSVTVWRHAPGPICVAAGKKRAGDDPVAKCAKCHPDQRCKKYTGNVAGPGRSPKQGTYYRCILKKGEEKECEVGQALYAKPVNRKPNGKNGRTVATTEYRCFPTDQAREGYTFVKPGTKPSSGASKIDRQGKIGAPFPLRRAEVGGSQRCPRGTRRDREKRSPTYGQCIGGEPNSPNWPFTASPVRTAAAAAPSRRRKPVGPRTVATKRSAMTAALAEYVNNTKRRRASPGPVTAMEIDYPTPAMAGPSAPAKRTRRQASPKMSAPRRSARIAARR